MNKTVTIITSGHPPFDERIFYKFGCTFKNNNYNVSIICSTIEIDTAKEGISIKGFDGTNNSKRDKIQTFVNLLNQFNPDVIICCEPLPILAAYKYKKANAKNVKIISDVTEWYPENVALKFSGIKKITTYLKLFLFNIYCNNLADQLIVGEESKKGRYDLIAPYKPKTIIGYYPVLKYFTASLPPFCISKEVFTFCYAGLITFERGIFILMDAALLIAQKYPKIKFRLMIFGRFQNKLEEEIFNARIRSISEIEIIRVDWVPYPKISEELTDVDLCFDLRNLTFIYRNSLPIKIFEYMAAGKPFIFTEVLPIKKEMKAEHYGFLVNPEDMKEILSAISNYVERPELLMLHSQNGRKVIEEKYNWESLEVKLVQIVEEN